MSHCMWKSGTVTKVKIVHAKRRGISKQKEEERDRERKRETVDFFSPTFFSIQEQKKNEKKWNRIKELLKHTRDNTYICSWKIFDTAESHVASVGMMQAFLNSFHRVFNSFHHIFRCFSLDIVWYRGSGYMRYSPNNQKKALLLLPSHSRPFSVYVQCIYIPSR